MIMTVAQDMKMNVSWVSLIKLESTKLQKKTQELSYMIANSDTGVLESCSDGATALVLVFLNLHQVLKHGNLPSKSDWSTGRVRCYIWYLSASWK